MGVIDTFVENWNDREWWYGTLVPYLIERYYGFRSHEGVDLMAEEWDNLIILDACRYDMFSRLDLPDGSLNSVVSAGSNTPEFAAANFDGGTFDDTVYVTANPQINIHADCDFHAMVNVWEDHWDEDAHTVLPEDMYDATVEAYRKYPNKRLIAHFIQPHHPFVGPGADRLDEVEVGMELSKRLIDGEERSRSGKTVWELLEDGDIDTEDVWTAYEGNLELAMEYVERLLSLFEERTVVTSDHGNLVGEYAWPFPVRMYGHPKGIHTEKLVKVPWFVTNAGQRKHITAGESTVRSERASEDVERRLEHLGYR